MNDQKVQIEALAWLCNPTLGIFDAMDDTNKGGLTQF